MRSIVLLALLFDAAIAAAQTPEAADDNSTLFDRASNLFEFRPEGTDEKFAKLEGSLLKWTNPVRKTAGGAVYLWSTGGRPAVAMCVYTYGETGLDWEMQSLSSSRVIGRRDGEDVWRPESAGLAFAPIPDVPPPAATEKLRLVQMRGLSRRFAATLGTADGVQRKLRRLAQPLHRYGSANGEARDGAVFAFVQGTDPEVLLLIEARDNEGQPRWEYALARMTGSPCFCELDGKGVWKVETWPWDPDPTLPYITFVGMRSQVPTRESP